MFAPRMCTRPQMAFPGRSVGRKLAFPRRCRRKVRETSGPGSFGKCLRRLRREAGLTQQMLADRSGVSVDAIGNHENGRARCPHPDTVELLANGLGLGTGARQALMA